MLNGIFSWNLVVFYFDFWLFYKVDIFFYVRNFLFNLVIGIELSLIIKFFKLFVSIWILFIRVSILLKF